MTALFSARARRNAGYESGRTRYWLRSPLITSFHTMFSVPMTLPITRDRTSNPK